MTTAPTRRERLRTATVAEIKGGARQLLRTGGPQAISLRGIARDMGMTAPAIYRYFPGLDALVGALAGDLFDEIRADVERARDGAGGDPIPQLVAMARALRRWAVTHPNEFALILGNYRPDIGAFEAACADPDHPGARLGAVFLTPLVALHRQAPDRAGDDAVDPRLAGALAPLLARHPELPEAVAYQFVSAWTRFYGLVAMEVFQHLQWGLTDPEVLFETELAAWVRGS